jgi:hypothetical protein
MLQKNNIRPISGEYFANRCDFNLGDQAGIHNSFPNYVFEEANLQNKKLTEFLTEQASSSSRQKVITLFIDNIRLAGLMPIRYKSMDESYLTTLIAKNNLFKVIEAFPTLNFIIFCALEDTEIDSRVSSLIPQNVLKIHAVNAFTSSPKVQALPNGIQRPIDVDNSYHEFVYKYLNNRRKDLIRRIRAKSQTSSLLFVSINIGTNPERKNIQEFFMGKKWVKVQQKRLKRRDYLKKLHQYPFTLCPQGNALGDTHREWEALYTGSVPVLERTPYLEEIHKGNPVLFVDKFQELTREKLTQHLYLFEELRYFDLSTWDADRLYARCVMESIIKNSS